MFGKKKTGSDGGSKVDKKALKKAEKKAKAEQKKAKKTEKKAGSGFLEKIGIKKKEVLDEPQYYKSAINTSVLNYRVYYLSRMEKVLYFLLAFIVGAAVGYIFFGGMGKNEFGEPTLTTYVLNIAIPVIVGMIAGKIFLPVRQEQILKNRKNKLRKQFRDMLECFSTSLSAGHNVTESFSNAYTDLNNQYEEGSFILDELKLINTGITNGVNAEDLMTDFGKRSGIQDIEDFASVFEISYRRGGNIKDVIRNTYEILSDKMTIEEEIETMVTGSKSELNLMLVLPVAMVALIKGSSPEFAANFASPAGIASTIIGLVFTAAAYLIGRKILDFGS